MSLDWTGEARFRGHLQVVRGVMASILPPENDTLLGNLKTLLIDSGSKMLRPTLVLLGALARLQMMGKPLIQELTMSGNDAFLLGSTLGKDSDWRAQDEDDRSWLARGLFPPRIYRLAAATELLHTATLVHDDIIDQASTRRGFPTLHTGGQVRRSVLAGDYLMSASLLLLSAHHRPGLAHQAARGIQLLCKGELIQARHTSVTAMTTRQYYRQIGGKTALLFVMALRGGAGMMSSPNDPGLSDALATCLGNWAYRVGMAFQITDDILDFRLHDHKKTKTSFRDYSQGIVTLPIILALENTHYSGPLATWCKKHPPGKNLSYRNQKTLRHFVMEASGFTLAENRCKNYLQSAQTCLATTGLDATSLGLFSDLATAMLVRRS